MTGKTCGNAYRTTMVCIDSYDAQVLAGRFYNPYLDHGETFESLTQFLLKMEHVLDGMKFPQSFTAARAFAPTPTLPTAPGPQEQVGRLATFAVRVLFRQNASWQGSVTWMEDGREACFRSVLELVLLMNSALSDPVEEARKTASA